MPLYTYMCKDCGEKFDLLVGVNAQKTEIKCKKCESKNVQKLMGGFSVGSSGRNSSAGPTCSTGSCPLG